MFISKRRYRTVFKWVLLVIRIVIFLLILLWPESAF